MKRLRDILQLDEAIVNPIPETTRFTEYPHFSPYVKDPTFDHPDYEIRYSHSNPTKTEGHFEANLVHKKTGMVHLTISGKLKKFRSGARVLSDINLFGAKTKDAKPKNIDTGLSYKMYEHMNKLGIDTEHMSQSKGAVKVEDRLKQTTGMKTHSYDPVTGIAREGSVRATSSQIKNLGKLGDYLARHEIVRELPTDRTAKKGQTTKHPLRIRSRFWEEISKLKQVKP